MQNSSKGPDRPVDFMVQMLLAQQEAQRRQFEAMAKSLRSVLYDFVVDPGGRGHGKRR